MKKKTKAKLDFLAECYPESLTADGLDDATSDDTSMTTIGYDIVGEGPCAVEGLPPSACSYTTGFNNTACSDSCDFGFV